MFVQDAEVQRLNTLVVQYCKIRKKRRQMVSINQAETAIREVMPNLPVSGEAFELIIAACAAEHGLAILFDGNGSYGPQERN
ncbi:MAG: hypothetical protein J0I79_26895 [Mesorhizobium sp.]|uniref:hypothetical protein n=1 Tax=Mesorhizobium sp. TaxID=1871066 RepID=UPI001AC43033|nr:hypothetical protein [Mesorhizobium sp.]MBN9221587.1 hypothetical protein [Mesorhizobium sp.]